MTTHDKSSPKKPRTKRPPLKRDKAIRNNMAAKKERAPDPADSERHDHSNDPAIDEVVANAVRTSYDTLAKTIAQGREAADKFRQGQYNMREVPADVETMILRLLNLARQLSGTTIDIVEQLVHQLTSVATLPEPGVTKVPPFREHGQASTRPDTSAPAGLPLAVRFAGSKTATSSTTSLARPSGPTRPDQMSAVALAPRTGKAKPLDKVEFSFDASIMGLVATVTIPPKQPPGTYVGYVVAEGQPEPLGLLVVTLG